MRMLKPGVNGRLRMEVSSDNLSMSGNKLQHAVLKAMYSASIGGECYFRLHFTGPNNGTIRQGNEISSATANAVWVVRVFMFPETGEISIRVAVKMLIM